MPSSSVGRRPAWRDRIPSAPVSASTGSAVPRERSGRGQGESARAAPQAPRWEAAVVSSCRACSRAELGARSAPVKGRAAEGVRIAGRLFGSGEVGVILDHMGAGDQSQWLEFAGQLAEQGYLVLTYDRRGSCPGGELGCSTRSDDGDGWKDLAFLADFLRGEGAERVGGASQGAMESLYALSEGLDADGLIWVAGVDLYNGVPVSEQVTSVRAPKLFISGDADEEAAATLDEFEDAPPPSEIVLLDTGEHGTDILAYAPVAIADEFRQTVVDFLETI